MKRMKENFDAKERLLLEERQKATEAHKYDSDSREMCLICIVCSNFLEGSFNVLIKR